MSKRGGRGGGSNRVRIIAGDWRSRVLAFPDDEALRPTPDRVRETLFNWLQFEVAGRRCLDLFAGSGVLGFEAVSRGASHAVLVDSSPAAVAAMQENIAALGTGDVEAVGCDAIDWLRRDGGGPYDIVFLDPPYHAGLLPRCCELLEQRQQLSKHARIYLETEVGLPHPDSIVPANWRCEKAGKAGQVVFALYARS